MLTDAGSIQLILHCRDKRVAQVEIRSTRPRISSIFAGQPVDKVASLIPMLFSLCGKAQGLAAARAVAAARGAEAPTGFDMPVAQEAALEHLWHLLFVSRRDAYMAGRRAILAGGYASVFETLAGLPPENWLALNINEIGAWAQQGESVLAEECRLHLSQPEPACAPTALLSELSAQQSLREWPCFTDAMAAHPVRQGTPAETGAFARLAALPMINGVAAERPLLARWLARVSELASLLARVELSGAPTTPSLTGGGRALSLEGVRELEITASLPGAFSSTPIGENAEGISTGRVCIVTARGLLMHEVVLRGETGNERVQSYHIVAPTEWNFHPEGVLQRWLSGCVADADLRDFAGRCIRALDPCVAWSCEIIEDRH